MEDHGKEINVRIEEAVEMSDVKDPDMVFSFLLHAGYLTYNKQTSD